MFKVVEALSNDPVRFPVKPGAKLTPGHVVSLVEYEGHLVLDMCDGYRPFGLMASRCHGGNELDITKRIGAWPQRMVVNLDKFDRSSEVRSGNSLYCNRRGTLSTRKPFEGALPLAKVISPADEEKKYMSILWL